MEFSHVEWQRFPKPVVGRPPCQRRCRGTNRGRRVVSSIDWNAPAVARRAPSDRGAWRAEWWPGPSVYYVEGVAVRVPELRDLHVYRDIDIAVARHVGHVVMLEGGAVAFSARTLPSRLLPTTHVMAAARLVPAYRDP